MEEKRYWQYWGKASKQSPCSSTKEESAYHLLVYHCLDVAAVAYQLLNDTNSLFISLQDFLQIDKEKLRNLLCFFMALHDLGKFSHSFQGLYQEGHNALLKVNHKRHPYLTKHDELGWWIYCCSSCSKSFEEVEDQESYIRGLDTLFNSVLGHHGCPVNNPSILDWEDILSDVRYRDKLVKENIDAANEWITDLAILFSLSFPLTYLQDITFSERLKQISWILSGLAMMADWIGSEQYYFPYQSQPQPLKTYWQKALTQAQQSLKDKGLWHKIKPKPFKSVQESFGFPPTPLQQWAENVSISSSPQLFILEDTTGAGKTEAALILAHRIMEKGDADGFYFGLPTTATSNAMFRRIIQFMSTLFGKQKNYSLVLSHSTRKMNPDFQRIIENCSTPSVYGKEEITAQCHAWFANNNKRALLANIGVGTIDQALFAVLPKKHQPLRLYGLHQKVLIFDEVHSADSYMLELLSSLLSIHLHQGGYAILLTATLSLDKREQLIKQWLGLPQAVLASPLTLTQKQHFPLATHVTYPVLLRQNNRDFQYEEEIFQQAVKETELDSPKRVSRTIEVEFLLQEQAVIQQIVEKAQQKKCIVWIRNTVADAQEAYVKLLQKQIEPEDILLFHSRFTLCDRQQIETKVLAWLGKDSTPEQRAGKIMICTQVFQESLDVDCDEMITDLCPMDYILQRVGRLHRHLRDHLGKRCQEKPEGEQARATPKLFIFSPPFEDNPTEDWFKGTFPRGASVYSHHGQLWLTMKTLLTQKAIRVPKDSRLLIEAVYSHEAQQRIPSALIEQEKSTHEKQRRQQNQAKDVLLDWSQGYCQDSNLYWRKGQGTPILTRYEDMPTQEVVLVKQREGVLYCYATKQMVEEAYVVEFSTIKISENLANKLTAEPTEGQKQALIQRFPQLIFDKLWLAEEDDHFTYNSQIGLMEKKK